MKKKLIFNLQFLNTNSRGITLIALIITVIIMLILVGVTVSVAINGGLFSKAKLAATETEKAVEEEQLKSAVLGLMDVNTGKVDLEKLQEQLKDWNIDKTTGECVSPRGNGYTINDYANIELGIYRKVTELFDENGKDENAEGYDPNKLHIGDFINYDAGTWSEKEISAIKVGPNSSLVSANNERTLPKSELQFGGFKVGDSRNENAEPFSSEYNYLKDSNGHVVTGWRVFDVEDDGSITLISAGCPEDFYVMNFSGNNPTGAISEFILSKTICSGAEGKNIEIDYIPRDWKDYKNNNPKVTEVSVLTRTKAQSWYNKYNLLDNDFLSYNNNTKQGYYKDDSIWKSKYGNIIENNSYYVLGSAYQWMITACISPHGVTWEPQGAGPVVSNRAYGIRVLICLSPDTKISKESVGTKTIVDPTNEENSWTYNVWDIK